MQRCHWCECFELYRLYHDTEWGVPLRDNTALFELLNLEGAQAGLSWSTVLKKRETYRTAFDQFDPEKIAPYDAHKVAELLTNPGIVRNRLKVAGESAPRTFSNRCLLDAAKATRVSEGECTSKSKPVPVPMVGCDVDAHGCKGSAGFQWSEALNQCLRPWLIENPPADASNTRYTLLEVLP